MEYNWFHYSELSTKQLYQILKLRAEVFVVEQNCVYLDPDGRDQNAYHLLATNDRNLCGCLRYFQPDAKGGASFGRIVTSVNIRGQGVAKKLMQKMIEFSDEKYNTAEISCSAQYYLKQFYEDFGFVPRGEIYLEDGIQHIAMQR